MPLKGTPELNVRELDKGQAAKWLGFRLSLKPNHWLQKPNTHQQPDPQGPDPAHQLATQTQSHRYPEPNALPQVPELNAQPQVSELNAQPQVSELKPQLQTLDSEARPPLDLELNPQPQVLDLELDDQLVAELVDRTQNGAECPAAERKSGSG
jgi:hypothetical protein